MARATVDLLVLVLTVAGCSWGPEPKNATLDDPHGCSVFQEGPAFLTYPRPGHRDDRLAVVLRTQFQTALPTSSSPGGAVAHDRTVLKRLGVRRPGNGLTYTEFQAVALGRTVVTATRRVGGRVTMLRMPVAVVCRSGDMHLGRFKNPAAGQPG